MAETWSGGCQCGAVRYEIDVDAIRTLYCCHCLECQHQSSSGFGMSLLVLRTGFKLHQGELGRWQRPTDAGGINRANFCTTCGVRIYHSGGHEDDIISLKAGTLDDTAKLTPIGHIWTKRAQPWVTLDPTLMIYEGQPETYDDLIAAYQAS